MAPCLDIEVSAGSGPRPWLFLLPELSFLGLWVTGSSVFPSRVLGHTLLSYLPSQLMSPALTSLPLSSS